MKITKEALLERNFEWAYEYPTRQEYELDIEPSYTFTVKLDDNGDIDVFIGEFNQLVEVPNCKTLEDLDHLIRLFQ